MDQSARVGDFCKIGEFMGTIQSIGMRSSRIRLLSVILKDLLQALG